MSPRRMWLLFLIVHCQGPPDKDVEGGEVGRPQDPERELFSMRRAGASCFRATDVA